MRQSIVSGVGTTAVIEVPDPVAGPADIVLRMRACGICGSDGMYIAIGGIPPHQGNTALGHEPAGEVIEVGADVVGIEIGDHLVVNPMASPTGVIGSGGTTGGLADLLLVQNAELGASVALVPRDLPWEVAALNEPMAVARHAVNRTAPKAGDRIVIFGAGPIGLGAAIGYKSLGVEHVTVVDIIPSRLEKALAVGADAVIDSAKEDVVARLIELQGAAPARRGVAKPATDIYLDAAGVASVIETVLTAAKHGATLGIVAVHKKPVPVDFGSILGSELNIVMSMGYPTEIFEVTADIIANRDRYALIVSDTFAFDDVDEALRVASNPGAADKVMVVFP